MFECGKKDTHFHTCYGKCNISDFAYVTLHFLSSIPSKKKLFKKTTNTMSLRQNKQKNFTFIDPGNLLPISPTCFISNIQKFYFEMNFWNVKMLEGLNANFTHFVDCQCNSAMYISTADKVIIKLYKNMILSLYKHHFQHNSNTQFYFCSFISICM